MTMTTHRAAPGRPAAGRHRARRRTVALGGAFGWQSCAGLAWTVLAVAGTLIGTCAVVLAVATRLSPAGQFTAFGHPVLVVLSGSMSPAIAAGDLIVDDPVRPAAARRLRPGQVVSFRTVDSSSAIITRRIAGVATLHGVVRYYTKGDANPSADATVRRPADVVGVVSYSVAGGGYLLTDLRRPLVLGLLTGSPLLWLLAGPVTANRACRRRRWPGAGWSRRACGRPSADES